MGDWFRSFDLSQPSAKSVTEVQVDAKSGRIVSLKNATPGQEMKKAKAEKAEKPSAKCVALAPFKL